MGLNISLIKLPPPWGSIHPEWDDMKYGGDREAARLMNSLPIEECDLATIDVDRGINVFYRPTDFAAWRAADWPAVNPDRWRLLIDLLEADPDYWIYLSY